jgi:hypothetical protein
MRLGWLLQTDDSMGRLVSRLALAVVIFAQGS